LPQPPSIFSIKFDVACPQQSLTVNGTVHLKKLFSGFVRFAGFVEGGWALIKAEGGGGGLAELADKKEV
jgi:hypothetical protein